MPSLLVPSLLALSTWFACSRPPKDGPEPPDDTTPPDDTVTGDDDDTTIDTSSTPTPTADTGPTTDIDCSVLPPLPVPFDVLEDFTRGEDFDFDGNGYHVSIRGRDLVAHDISGNVRVLSPGVGMLTAGTRTLVTGDYVVADSGVGGLVLVDGQTGGQTNVNTNMSYPNGVEVDRQNRAYVADNNRGNVRMIDVYTGNNGIIASGLNNPNGVILSPDEQTLYVGSFGGGMVYAIDRISDLEWDTPRILYQATGLNGGFDGINVDQCGNVYITEYTTGRVFRITPDGARAEMVVDLPSGWIPNMRWGHDIGGWDRNRLYVADRDRARLFVLDVGIPGKKHVLMP